MKKHEFLTAKSDELRKLIEEELSTVCGLVKDAYLKENPEVESMNETEDSIELNYGVTFFLDDFDPNICEYIEKITIDGKTITTSISKLPINVVSNENLIEIVRVLENLLEKPETIDIF